MKATRERQIEFMEGFGTNALHTAVSEALYKYGPEHWLTDEQLSEIVSDKVSNWRSTQKMNRRNREITRTALSKTEDET